MSVGKSAILLFLFIKPIVLANHKFPDGFLFGVATSAYQIEGGYENRGETVFDHYHRLNPSMVHNSATAKTACDSYHKATEDIALLTHLGVDFYRFSIAWSRILPSGFPNQINSEGIEYYNNLIDELVAHKIQPMVTMHHYDLPQQLQNLGGWANPLLADLFEEYARVLFDNFGDRVKLWVTFNVNFWGCGSDGYPPMLNHSGIAEYWYTKSLVLAHAKVYQMYQKEFNQQKAKIGFTVDGKWFEPATPSKDDLDAAERSREFATGLMLNPLFEGDFPQVVKERVKELSLKQGFKNSRLPSFSNEEKELIKGSYDFFGLNIYTTFLVKNQLNDSKLYSYEEDMGVEVFQNPLWKGAKSSWLKIVPWGMRRALNWVKNKYGDPEIWITENGFSDDGQLEDYERINYLKLYLKALLDALDDGVKVKGYAAWSLMDNFEWLAGYNEKFGLYQVNFNDPQRPRKPKASAKWYKKLLETRTLDVSYEKSEL